MVKSGGQEKCKSERETKELNAMHCQILVAKICNGGKRVLLLELEGEALWNLSSSAKNIGYMKTVHKKPCIWEMGKNYKLPKCEFKGKWIVCSKVII